MSARYRIAQQVGDLTFGTDQERDTEAQALLAVVDMTAAADEEVELFVSGTTTGQATTGERERAIQF